MSYIVGVDIGGTFTDCVALEARAPGEGPVVIRIGKALSTPPQFQTGFIDAVRAAAALHGVALESLLADARLYHGCTVGTNALVEHKTASVGFLTTRGHADSIFIMKAGARLKWMHADYIARVSKQTKPDPIIPRALCEEIDERVAFDGNVLVALNEARARAAIGRLLAQNVDAIAISLLWAIANPAHERRLRELVREQAPDLFVSISCEVSPKAGEYERSIATIVNAMIGPPMRHYLRALEAELRAHGYRGGLQIMSCTGGLIDADHARQLPVLTIGSGPVAGLIGATNLAKALHTDEPANVLTADVGGTTLDIGTISRGVPVRRATASHGQFEYFVPTLDVRSVGAGGGSLIQVHESQIRVGPHSAGARPGPICFQRGGDRPTVTDAAAVLGYLNPDYFFGGKLKLDIDAAASGLARLGAPLEMDAVQTAAAAMHIIDSQMADAIWLTLTQQGYDARDYTLYSFGGAGGLHATAMARELRIKRVIVPLSNLAAGWSAFGVAASDALLTESLAVGLASPFDPQDLNHAWQGLEKQVRARLERQGVPSAAIRLERYADLRYSLQINEVAVRVPDETYTTATIDRMLAAFETQYERLYGKGSGYAAAGYQLTGLHVHGRASLSDVRLEVTQIGNGGQNALKGERDIIWYAQGNRAELTPVYDGPAIPVGAVLRGPAILEYPDTTVVVDHLATASIHPTGSVALDVVTR